MKLSDCPTAMRRSVVRKAIGRVAELPMTQYPQRSEVAILAMIGHMADPADWLDNLTAQFCGL